MKKLILFVFILAIIPIVLISISSNRIYLGRYYPFFSKDKKWEYVKERVFDGETENVNRYSGPILVELNNASKLDSVAIENHFEELRALIPNKEINYLRSFTGGIPLANLNLRIKGYKYSDLSNIAISINISEVDSLQDAYSLKDIRFLNAVKPNGRYITMVNMGISSVDRPSGFNGSHVNFKFHKSQTVEERQEIIRFYLVRMISCASLFKERTSNNFDVNGAMLNSLEVSSDHLEFTAYDKFLLQKLYSPTFLEDFKDYMYDAYPWRVASNFINKDKTELISNWVRSILLVILFFLGFSILYKRQYKFRFLSYFLPIAIGLICILHTSMVQIFIAIPTISSYSYLSFLLHDLLLALIVSLGLMVFDKYVIKKGMTFMMQIILKICFTFLMLIVPILIEYVWWGVSYDWFLNFHFQFAIALFFSIGRGILIYLDHFSENLIKQKDIELSNLKALNAQAEVKLLQSQINPHFLYNALNSIASLAHTDASKTENMALSLSDLFKYTINRKGKKKNAIRDEVEMIKTYLEVEQIRFGDRLSYKFQVDESLNDIEIPMFLIQPLIENAVKHGVSKIEGTGEIQLIINKNKEGLVIMVTDNGPQFPDGLVSGHGLQTVYDLLKFSYADNASINIANEPVKQITITINTQF